MTTPRVDIEVVGGEGSASMADVGALFVHTKELTPGMAVSPASPRSDSNSPPHMFMAITPGSAFGSADSSRSFLQGFKCCGQAFDDLYQLLGHQSSGLCVMGAVDTEAAKQGAKGTFDYASAGLASALAGSNDGGNVMLSLSPFLSGADLSTPKTSEFPQFPTTDLSMASQQTHGTAAAEPRPQSTQQPTQTHQFAYITASQPFLTQQTQHSAPMLLASLPDGRTVLVPIVANGQIPGFTGEIPMQTAYATGTPVSMTPTTAQVARVETPKPAAVARSRVGSTSERSMGVSMHMLHQIEQEQREQVGSFTSPAARTRSRTASRHETQGEGMLRVPSHGPGSPSGRSISPASPGSDFSGSLSPALFATGINEELGTAPQSTKMTPFLAGLDLTSSQARESAFQAPEPQSTFDFESTCRALGITGLSNMGTPEVQAYLVQGVPLLPDQSYLPMAHSMGGSGINPTKLFGDSGMGSASGPVPRTGSPESVPVKLEPGESPSPSRPAKRKPSIPVDTQQATAHTGRFLLREKDQITASPSSSPNLSRRDSRGGSVASTVPASPTLEGTPKKRKPSVKEELETIRKTSMRGFSGALNLVSMSLPAPDRVQSLISDPRAPSPKPAAPTPKHTNSAPIIGYSADMSIPKLDFAALFAAAPGGFGLPALPTKQPAQKFTPPEPTAKSEVDVDDFDEKPKRRRPKKRYICPIGGCGKEYKNLGGLKYHKVHFHKIPLIRRSEMSEHDKPYQCPVATCPRGYGSAGGLKYHLSHAHPPEVVEEAVKSDPKGLKTRQMPARNRAVGYAEDDEDEFDEDEDGEYEEDV